MAVREDSKEPKRTGLEGLSLSQLIGKFINETFTYREDLSISLEESREQITKEYMQRTKSLREELDRRERLYLKYNDSFIFKNRH